MPNSGSAIHRLDLSKLEFIFNELQSQDYQNIGHVARDGAIMLDVITSFDQLAKGYTEIQGRGNYQLNQKEDQSLFGYTVGPQSFKKYLHPPRRRLWSAKGSKNAFHINYPDPPPKMAFWGVRNCDLTAIKRLDRIFLEGSVVNPWYRSAREELFIIASACAKPSENCFCTTMKGGPSPDGDFDISLTEILQGSDHYFLADFKSQKAKEFFDPTRYQVATADEIEEGRLIIEKAVKAMMVRFDPTEAAGMLKRNLEHRLWEEIASRCLSCANCNMVCPTCFCTSTEDITDITGEHTERWIRWDSCFNGNFSYLHGGSVRTKTSSCYRQWMTHKLSTWYDQFGSAGCVGCGRCIAWCPVGIDLTEEVGRMKESEDITKKENITST